MASLFLLCSSILLSPQIVLSQTYCNIDGTSSTYTETLITIGATINRRIQASGCPNHDSTCVGKPGTCTCNTRECRGETLNRTLSVFINKDFEIPARPCISDIDGGADITCDGGDIGIIFNGVSLFSPTAGGDACEDAVEAEFTAFSKCGGHATPYGEFHHHLLPSCLLYQLNAHGVTNPNNEHSPQIGWSMDGFPVYGPHGNDGKYIYKCTHPNANANDCLDECNGHGIYDSTGKGHEIDGFNYHYHVTGPVADLSGPIKTTILDPAPDTSMYPYTIGCWKGIPLNTKPATFRKANCALDGVTSEYVPKVMEGISHIIYPKTLTMNPTPEPTSNPTQMGETAMPTMAVIVNGSTSSTSVSDGSTDKDSANNNGENDEKEANLLPIYIGAGVGSLCLIGGVIVGIICWRKKGVNKEFNDTSRPSYDIPMRMTDYKAPAQNSTMHIPVASESVANNNNAQDQYKMCAQCGKYAEGKMDTDGSYYCNTCWANYY